MKCEVVILLTKTLLTTSYDTVRLLERVGSPGLSPEAEKRLSSVLNEMGRIYGSHKVNQLMFHYI